MNRASSFDRLLHLRRNLEHQEELKLAEATRRWHGAAAALEALQRDQDEERRALGRRMAQGLSGAELQFAAGQAGVAAQRREQLALEVVELQAVRERQLAVFTARMRDRKVLEAAKAHRAAEHRRLAERRQQSQLDELLLQRHGASGVSARE